MTKIWMLTLICLMQISVVAQIDTNKILKTYFDKISFVENKGQIMDERGQAHKDIKYYGSKPNFKFYFKNDGLTYRVDKILRQENEKDPVTGRMLKKVHSTGSNKIELTWLGMNKNVAVSPEQTDSKKHNFYLGKDDQGNKKEVQNATSSSKLKYKELYHGIDLVYYEHKGQLKYDFLVKAGADYSQIKISYKGAEAILLPNGDVELKTKYGSIIESKPVVYQGGKELVASWLVNGNVLSLDIKNVSRNESLVIDPLTYYYQGNGLSSYDGENADWVSAVKTDANGNTFVVINTLSTGGLLQSLWSVIAHGGSYNFVILKIAPNGDETAFYSAPRSGNEYVYDMAIDASGSVCVVGSTSDWNSYSFPNSTAYQRWRKGPRDAFLMKLSNNLEAIWSTYYGGPDEVRWEFEDTFGDGKLGQFVKYVDFEGWEYGVGIDVDNQNNVYITGITTSNDDIWNGAGYDATIGGKTDGFIAKFNTNGGMIWSTYVGGSNPDQLFGCAVLTDQSVVVGGYTSSTDLPGTNLSNVFAGTQDGLIVRVNANGAHQWNRYVAGSEGDYIYDLAADDANHVYVVGQTNSSNLNHPLTAHQVTKGVGIDAFLLKVSSDGSVDWSTYIGGDGNDSGRSVAYDSNKDQILISGLTNSNTKIATEGVGIQESLAGAPNVPDYFLNKFCQSGKRIWGTYFGTPGTEASGDISYSWEDVAVSDAGVIFLGGTTYGVGFPNGYQVQPENYSSFLVGFNDNTTNFDCSIGGPGCSNCPLPPFDPTNVYSFDEECKNCLPNMALASDRYVLTAWVKVPGSPQGVLNYTTPSIKVRYGSAPNYTYVDFAPSGQIIDGWQRIEAEFAYNGRPFFNVTSGTAYFDDIRMHPVNGSMKSYVYDPITLRMIAELDERNYATLYEYDEEGKLVRVKKETEKGVMTIQENRSNTFKNN